MTEHCDLVMKGGITSGVFYPKLTAQLASKYQFKNIGGTSAGAIAAGACAAVQYGKNNGHMAFEALEDLPDLLGEKSKDGTSKLFRLFQPAMSLRKHFSVFVRVLNRKPRDATAEVLKGLGAMYKEGLSVGLLLGSLLMCPFITALHSNIGVVTTLVTALCMMLLVAGFTTLSIFSALNGQLHRIVLWLLGAWGLMVAVLMVFTGQGLTWQLLGSILAIRASFPDNELTEVAEISIKAYCAPGLGVIWPPSD